MNLFFGLILVLLIGIPNHCLVINKASGEQKEKVEGENELAVFDDHDLDNENVTVVDLIKSLQIFKKRDEKLYEAFAALSDRVKSLELKNSFLLDQVNELREKDSDHYVRVRELGVKDEEHGLRLVQLERNDDYHIELMEELGDETDIFKQRMNEIEFKATNNSNTLLELVEVDLKHQSDIHKISNKNNKQDTKLERLGNRTSKFGMRFKKAQLKNAKQDSKLEKFKKELSNYKPKVTKELLSADKNHEVEINGIKAQLNNSLTESKLLRERLLLSELELNKTIEKFSDNDHEINNILESIVKSDSVHELRIQNLENISRINEKQLLRLNKNSSEIINHIEKLESMDYNHESQILDLNSNDFHIMNRIYELKNESYGKVELLGQLQETDLEHEDRIKILEGKSNEQESSILEAVDAKEALMDRVEYLERKSSFDKTKDRDSAMLKLKQLKPESCQEIKATNSSLKNGVYNIYPRMNNANDFSLQVYCEMLTEDRGWIVIHRHKDAFPNFNQNWNSYQDGFGSFTENYWIGLENMHVLTKNKDMVLRIDLIDTENRSYFAKYNVFHIGDEKSGYTLNFGEYTGTAGDSLGFSNIHQGRRFSTWDRDNAHRCGMNYKSGWWYRHCFATNLNTVHGSSFFKWFSPQDGNIELQYARMMITPRN